VAFNPYLIYAHVGYSESLYFTLAACALAALDRRQWVVSGLAGGMLSATRMQGVVFTAAYVVGCVRKIGIKKLLRQPDWNMWLGLTLCPIGLCLYLIYLYHLTGDALAPMHSFVAWGLKTGNPVEVLASSIRQGGWLRYWAFTAIGGIIVGIWLAFMRKWEMAVFVVLCVLMPASAEVAGMPRFVWWQPPTLYAVYRLLQRFPTMKVVYGAFAGGMAAVTIYLWMIGSMAVL
jgi:Gpi18-like mannosyltransferase